MSWRDSLLPASYNGAKFYVNSSDFEFGRRVEVATFPGSNEAIVNDFGQESQTYNIEGYIVQNVGNSFDYKTERDALVNALNTVPIVAGKLIPGTLVHPYYGEMNVFVNGRCSISERWEEGGIARIRMSFVKVSPAVQKTGLPSLAKTAAAVSQKSLAAISGSGNFTQAVDATILDQIANASDGFADTFKPLRAFNSMLKDQLTGNAMRVQQALSRIRGTFSSLISTGSGIIAAATAKFATILDSPCLIFGEIEAVCRTIAGACGIGKNGVFGGVIGICSSNVRGETTELDGETVPATLGSSAVTESLNTISAITYPTYSIPASQENNIQLSDNAFKFLLFTVAIQVCVRTEFFSKEDLIAYTDKISKAIYTFMLDLGSQIDSSGYDYVGGDFLDTTSMYEALAEMRNTLVQSMYAKAADLAGKTDFTVPAATISTLELAYERYGDITRADEIYNFNRVAIRHPGFLPQGQTIGVLSE